MDGQAESAPESGGLGDLASFLADTPEGESIEQDEEQTTDEPTAESDTDESENDEQDEAETVEPAPVAKITFKVKGEDGTEETVEATTDELASSYLRQKDYTKKTQALAERESQAVQFLTQKHEEIRNQYLSQAETARAAVAQMAGLKSESELAELAQSDPAAWVAESQRQKQINAFISGLDRQIHGERQRAAQEAQQRQAQHLNQQYQTSWAELAKAKIDKPALEKIYGATNKNYGFSQEELGNVYDHRLVHMMRDAAAYRDLQAQKATVTKKVQDAPRMPSKQSSPAQERQEQALTNRFKTGRAKLNDLAAFLR